MRITLPIDDQLLAEAEQVAAVSGKTLAELIEEALREHVNRRRFASRRERVVLHTFKGDGLQPGVNLDDSAAVLDLMNEPDCNYLTSNLRFALAVDATRLVAVPSCLT